MADPLSIIAGAAGLADVCIRLTKFIKHAKDGFQKIDEDLDDLSKEITALGTASELIKSSFQTELTGNKNPNENHVIADHWHATETTLAGCQDIVEKLDKLMKTILDTGGTKYVKFNSLRKYLKQQSKEEDFTALRHKLSNYNLALQTNLAAVNM